MPIVRLSVEVGRCTTRSSRYFVADFPEVMSRTCWSVSSRSWVSCFCVEVGPDATWSEAFISPEVSSACISSGEVESCRSARGGAKRSPPRTKLIPSAAAVKLCVSFISERSSPSRRSLAERGVSEKPKRCRSSSTRSKPIPVVKPWREKIPSSCREKFAPGFILLRERPRLPSLSDPSSVTSWRVVLPQEASWTRPLRLSRVRGLSGSKPLPSASSSRLSRPIESRGMKWRRSSPSALRLSP